MEKIVSFCGLICSECPAFLATQNNSDDERKEVAEKWSVLYKANLKPEDINCDGCLAEGKRLIGYCRICEIRKCGREKKVVNCGHCLDYPCGKLDQIFKAKPECKTTLENIKEKLI